MSPLLWFGENSPLLEACWAQDQIYHVQDTKALLQALEYGVAPCLVMDMALTQVDFGSLLTSIRAQWPLLGVIGLLNNTSSFPEIDETISPNASAEQLLATLERMEERLRQRRLETGEFLVSDYQELASRMRRLEGLAQVGAAGEAVLSTSQILGDLQQVAHQAVDADGIAILVSNDDYDDLLDIFQMGVVPAYLHVCREYFRSLPQNLRTSYLAEEVLLHARLPEMLNSVPRVREAEAAGAWSYMRLPLIVERRLCGFVAFFANTPDQFDGAHLQLARLFAAQVATAVRNMQLYMRINQAERRQKAVNRISRLMVEEAALDMVLTSIVEEAVKLVDARFGTVMLLDADQELVIRALYGHSSPPIGFHVPRDVGQAGYVVETGEFSIVTDYDHWELSNPAMHDALPEGAILYGVPLTYRGRVVGVLQVVGVQQPTTIMGEIEEMLLALALPAAIAIVNAELHEILLQDQQQLQAILDYTSAAVAVFGPDGSVLLLNPEAGRVLERLNISSDGVQGRRLGDLLAEMLPDESFDLAGIGSVVEINLGEVGEYLVHVAPIVLKGGTIYRYVAVGQDVSELRRLDRMKSDLIHILSHDLRNPLGLARGSIDLLDEPDLPADQRVQLKEMIVSSLERMDQLIRDVVDLEMAQSLGEETALPYPLPATIQKVIKRNELKANQQDVELIYEEYSVPPDKLKGHVLLISQAIDNLVNNGIKYTPVGGRVQVSLDVEDDYAVIRVEDTGYGIPAEHLPHLFRQFYRVNDKRTRHIHRTGVGLILVRAIVAAHGGRVSVESQVDVRSIFSIYLPLETSRPSQAVVGQIKRFDLADQISKRLGSR